MKLLIDVEEEVYNALKRVGDYLLPTSNNLSGKVYQAVANGTPYNPAGVLTEAEKIICRVYLEDLDKMHTCNEYKLLMSLIDNTQAVDLWQMRQEATENALKKAEVLYGRPKGECVDISKLRLMTVEECAGHTIDYAMGWKACIEWIKKGGVE